MKKHLFLLLFSVSCLGVAATAKADDVSNLANAAVSKGKSVFHNALGNDLPDWAKRIEWDLKLNEDLEPTGSILTVQPLYQDVDKTHTFFTQASYLNYEQFDDRKNTTNIGLGYRYVTMDHALMVGANVFYDHEWDEGHDRIGVGAEAKMAMLDFTANYYDAISDEESVGANDTEQALDGYDLELRSQVPYMPWARLGVGYYEWNGEDFDDASGIKASLDMDILPNLGVEVGIIEDDDDTQDTQVFANLTFSFGNNGKARPLSDNTGTLFTHGLDRKPFVMRDMRDHTLNKVRRQNKIVTERNSAGITISRAN